MAVRTPGGATPLLSMNPQPPRTFSQSELRILHRLMTAEVMHALDPKQDKTIRLRSSKARDRLHRDELIKQVEVETLEHHVSLRWTFTLRGHILYCEECGTASRMYSQIAQ